MPAELWSLMGVVLTAAAAIFGAWISNRGRREESIATQYQKLLQSVNEWNDKLADSEKATREMLAERDLRIDGLEERLDRIASKYKYAVDHIRALRVGHPSPPDLPPAIVDDI